MKALVTVYLGRWNHQIEIEVRGMPKKYEGLYDLLLLDEEIKKLVAWGDQDEPLHDGWISATSFKSTGEAFGLIYSVSPVACADASNKLKVDASIEAEADTVLNTLLELETEVTDEAALLNGVPELARWLSLTFGRWQPSGQVKGSDEWDYFTTNIAHFQGGSGSNGKANNYSSIQWSAFAEDWNRMTSHFRTIYPEGMTMVYQIYKTCMCTTENLCMTLVTNVSTPRFSYNYSVSNILQKDPIPVIYL
jgi:hypothetical protein